MKQANHIQPCGSLWKIPLCLFLPLLTEKRRLVLIKLASRSFCRAAANVGVSVRPRPASSCLSNATWSPRTWSSLNKPRLKPQEFWFKSSVILAASRGSFAFGPLVKQNKTRRILPRAWQNNSGLCLFSLLFISSEKCYCPLLYDVCVLFFSLSAAL